MSNDEDFGLNARQFLSKPINPRITQDEKPKEKPPKPAGSKPEGKYDPECVMCSNEGGYSHPGRPHVYPGQE